MIAFGLGSSLIAVITLAAITLLEKIETQRGAIVAKVL